MAILINRQFITLLLLSLLMAISNQSSAAVPVEKSIDYLFPVSPETTLTDIQENNNWQSSQDGWIKEHYSQYTFWFGETPKVAWLKIDSTQWATNDNNPYLIELASSGLSRAKLYFYLDGRWQTLDSETLLKDAQDSNAALELYRSRFITFEVNEKWRTMPLYLKVSSPAKFHLQVNIVDKNTLVAEKLKTEAFFFFCYGILFVMIFYNLIIGRYLQDTLYYIYSLVILSTLIYQFFAHGHGKLFGYLDWDQVNHALNFLAMISAWTALIFIYRFLNFKTYMPRFAKYFKIFLVTFGLLALLTLVLPTNAGINIALICAGPAPLLVMSVALWSWHRGSRLAGVYVFAWSFYILGGLLWGLYWLGIVPLSNLVEFPLVAGAALESILLSLALGLRIQLIKRQSKILSKSEKYYKEISALDPMTGLANRRAFDQEMDKLINEGGNLNLVLLDIDHFKNYNDSYGHLAGDKVIKKLSAILQEAVREEDMAARIGGEEFALILRNEKVEMARNIAERIRLLFSQTPFYFSGQNIHCTVSIGIAILELGESAIDIIERADKALYRAKDKGRNQTQMSVKVIAS